jgi:hypothetical protein
MTTVYEYKIIFISQKISNKDFKTLLKSISRNHIWYALQTSKMLLKIFQRQ